MHGKSNREVVETTHNLARYFAENRSVTWVLLVGTILWGIFGYVKMPKAKDPTIPVGVAAAVCVWPGAPPGQVEELVTKRIEAKIAENADVERIESNTRNSVVVIAIFLKQSVTDTAKAFDDINLKLESIHDLPFNAGPIHFIKDFGDISTLLLTVASPKVSDIELELRAKSIRRAIEDTRAQASAGTQRATLISCFPGSLNPRALLRLGHALAPVLEQRGLGRDPRYMSGPGFLGIDIETDLDDLTILNAVNQFLESKVPVSELHPDLWPLMIVREPEATAGLLKEVAGDKYTYRELDEFSDELKLRLQQSSHVSKVTKSGVLPERIYLNYTQQTQAMLASSGVNLSTVSQIVAARSINIPGAVLEAGAKDVSIDLAGELKSEEEIGQILLGQTPEHAPIFLKDVVEIERGYESPPQFLNFVSVRDPSGAFKQSRAITLSVQMRLPGQVADFGEAVDEVLASSGELVPEDLIITRVSDQPLQVEENTHLFMRSLYEAIALVVLVAFVGFWEWRSAMIMALSVPITLALTFGLMIVLGIDIQQVSLASLIIALGLLVDDPVVAGDAIKRALGEGWKPVIAAWLGPTNLGRAILYATVTNIVAYLPFLVLTGDVGRFIYSLPVVLTCSLVASRIVSMSFIPLLAYYFLRPPKEAAPTPELRRTRGFARIYCQIAGWAIDHRKLVLALSLIPVALGFWAGYSSLKTSFFPKELSYLSYVDIWLPEDAPISSTRSTAARVEKVIERVAEDMTKQKGEGAEPVLDVITSYIGGGGPRFWLSVFPEQQQPNYAQLLVKVNDKHDTPQLVVEIQDALTREISGARIDVRELINGKSVGHPVSVRIAGEDAGHLREYADDVKRIFQATEIAERVRDDWGAEGFSVHVRLDPDRANQQQITTLDLAMSSAVEVNGWPVGTMREHDKQIPIIARLRSEERAQLSDIQNLRILSVRGTQNVRMRDVTNLEYGMETERIHRRNQFRTITVSAFPVEGSLPSEVMRLAQPEIDAMKGSLPPGYTMEVGGEQEEQIKGFNELKIVLILSIIGIYLALVMQFKSAMKPVMVFAAIPYGVAAALATLALVRMPFGFMAFLGIISLIGVIVSHIIVLFDFVEEQFEEGAPLRGALLDAAILRLRPVAITTGATVLGLVPLAKNGGPLWEPLCYAQMGGLTIATGLTLFIVPVLYAICVFDLKVIKWDLLAHDADEVEDDMPQGSQANALAQGSGMAAVAEEGFGNEAEEEAIPRSLTRVEKLPFGAQKKVDPKPTIRRPPTKR